jgi:hypothetical protein
VEQATPGRLAKGAVWEAEKRIKTTQGAAGARE